VKLFIMCGCQINISVGMPMVAIGAQMLLSSFSVSGEILPAGVHCRGNFIDANCSRSAHMREDGYAIPS